MGFHISFTLLLLKLQFCAYASMSTSFLEADPNLAEKLENIKREGPQVLKPYQEIRQRLDEFYAGNRTELSARDVQFEVNQRALFSPVKPGGNGDSPSIDSNLLSVYRFIAQKADDPEFTNQLSASTIQSAVEGLDRGLRTNRELQSEQWLNGQLENLRSLNRFHQVSGSLQNGEPNVLSKLSIGELNEVKARMLQRMNYLRQTDASRYQEEIHLLQRQERQINAVISRKFQIQGVLRLDSRSNRSQIPDQEPASMEDWLRKTETSPSHR